MFVNGFSNLSLQSLGPLSGSLQPVAQFKLDADVSKLFPYINAVADNAILYENPYYILIKVECVKKYRKERLKK